MIYSRKKEPASSLALKEEANYMNDNEVTLRENFGFNIDWTIMEVQA